MTYTFALSLSLTHIRRFRSQEISAGRRVPMDTDATARDGPGDRSMLISKQK